MTIDSDTRRKPTPDASRRRVMRFAVSAPPIVATLASRPVLGAKPAAASAHASLAASRVNGKDASAGRPPEEWVNTASWPEPYLTARQAGGPIQAGTQYHGATTGLAGSAFAGFTMLAVMQLPSDGEIHSLARYASAALLNARQGLTPTLSEPMVRSMWNQFVSRGYYEPVEGVRWQAGDIVRYIRSTMA